MPSDEFWSYFFEIYEAIPRQGPGDRESTERALGLLPPLTSHHRILYRRYHEHFGYGFFVMQRV